MFSCYCPQGMPPTRGMIEFPRSWTENDFLFIDFSFPLILFIKSEFCFLKENKTIFNDRFQ